MIYHYCYYQQLKKWLQNHFQPHVHQYGNSITSYEFLNAHSLSNLHVSRNLNIQNWHSTQVTSIYSRFPCGLILKQKVRHLDLLAELQWPISFPFSQFPYFQILHDQYFLTNHLVFISLQQNRHQLVIHGSLLKKRQIQNQKQQFLEKYRSKRQNKKIENQQKWVLIRFIKNFFNQTFYQNKIQIRIINIIIFSSKTKIITIQKRSYKFISYFIEQIMTKQIAIKLSVGVGAVIAGVLANKYLFPKPKTTHSQQSEHHQNFKPTCALLGDVGGTNIRLELVIIRPPNDTPERLIKKEEFLVSNQPDFGQCLRKFLEAVQVYPQVAAIAMAGPVKNNSLSMANVRKWGVISGDELGKSLKIHNFRLLNDFQANSYGILLVPDEDFVSLNGFQMDKNLTCGIMGPGTGLGNSILYTTPFRHRKRAYVLGSEGGHTDVPYINDEVIEYIKYFQKNLNIPDISYISLQRSFCGPAIPMMYKFFQQKFPESQKLPRQVIDSADASKQIIKKCLQENPSIIFEKVFKLFMKIYEAAIGNYLAQHMCIGGLILVGSLTNGIMPKLSKMNLLEQWKKRHVQFYKNIESVPLIVCKQVDLGLKGAFVMARRIISDEQHE